MSYSEMMAYVRETTALGQVAGRLGWDQETMMPRGAAPQRGEESAAMAAVLHARSTDPRLGAWLENVTPADEVEAAQMRLVRRGYERAVKVPADLASEIARVTSQSQGIWAEARANDDFKSFVQTFENVVRLKREEGAALADGGDVYDAMLQDYEPGANAQRLSGMFDAMRPKLVELRDRVLASAQPPALTGLFDEAKQLQVSTLLAQTFGYDLTHGRIDKAVHPFSSGSGLDVRITTRTAPQDPFNCFYSTIHEVGHACYEQNIDRAYLMTPVGSGASMGVHESQSRIYENQLGRSRAFTGWLFGQMRDTFGDFGVADEEAFYRTVNRVQNGFIRTEADEVQYNLHVMLRFDLERALIAGDLQVADLEAAWNDRFKADFGYDVDRVSNGVLQDVHWPVGLFGYFATYTLGNVYAGCLYQALRRDVADLDAQLAKGNTSGATGWLRRNVQTYGGLFEPEALIVRAAGEVSEAPLLGYLEEKFGAFC
ncbi:carboxypeptidase M32 [Nereida sp. MMG025]|uniref:carboxypeptidase M32 n=1 Tax=Nereida sp. MMG025 TaxID=2909981 RepID=UPI001F2B4748|nr:carboxypeptidase M32 [Nereida sp. MMG025]MCF6443399.1 carboxypeptidase M32 [Nereida sp. MMG025]